MKLKSILSLGGLILFTSLSMASTAQACGGEKDTRLNSDKPKEERQVQSEAREAQQVAVQSNEVYGPPAPMTELGIGMRLSETGAR